MIKRLIKHGNSRAIVIDKALLEVAGISEDTPFKFRSIQTADYLFNLWETTNRFFEEKFTELNETIVA